MGIIIWIVGWALVVGFGLVAGVVLFLAMIARANDQVRR